MKRSLQLIILLAISGGWSVAHLITQNKQYPTLETDVKNTIKNLYLTLNENPVLEEMPEWMGEAAVECAKNYQTHGVTFFHFKTILYLITIASVVLMFLWRRLGYYVYILAQIGAIAALFVAFRFNMGSFFLAILSALMSLIMILLYKRHFLNVLNQPEFND